MKIRHPEKINTSDKLSPLKPNWLKIRFKSGDNINSVKEIVKKNKVHTVCEEANCPNLSECWSKKHATFMICLLYTSPSPRDPIGSRMPSSA